MTSRRVLIVEDNPDHIAILERRLRSAGDEPVVARTGAEAFARAAEGGLDAAILDLKLPDMDGEEALVGLLARVPDLPVLVLSATGFGDAVQRTLDAGARACLLKPLSRAELLEALDRLWDERAP